MRCACHMRHLIHALMLPRFCLFLLKSVSSLAFAFFPSGPLSVFTSMKGVWKRRMNLKWLVLGDNKNYVVWTKKTYYNLVFYYFLYQFQSFLLVFFTILLVCCCLFLIKSGFTWCSSFCQIVANKKKSPNKQSQIFTSV